MSKVTNVDARRTRTGRGPFRGVWAALCALVLTLIPAEQQAQAVSKDILSQPPELVVIMVVDQLRADYLRRHYKRFLPPEQEKGRVGGFRFLMERGSYYPVAEFRTMHTLTAPNHATLSTGAWPNRHGVVMNQYLDQSLTPRYCVGDGRYRILGGDPKRRSRGVAPTNLQGPTLGDAIPLHTSFAAYWISVRSRAR